MAEAVYLLCALTSVVCAWLLLRGYQESRTRLLFWSSLAFAGLALNNILLFIDIAVFPTTYDLSLWRSGTAVFSLLVLLVGLVGEVR